MLCNKREKQEIKQNEAMLKARVAFSPAVGNRICRTFNLGKIRHTEITNNALLADCWKNSSFTICTVLAHSLVHAHRLEQSIKGSVLLLRLLGMSNCSYFTHCAGSFL